MNAVKQRDISIDILKCLAAIIITNSHMELLYGDYPFLATGGAIGDALFFFCSGYTLFLGRDASFFNWYKRRINRIYPTIFAWILICSIFGFNHWNQRGLADALINGGEWFITCIMIYYIILWFVKRYAVNHLEWVFGSSAGVVILWYWIFGICDITGGNNIYGGCYFKWVFFFLFMLLGAIMGLRRKQCRVSANYNLLFNVAGLLLTTIAFYGLCWFKYHDGWYDYLQISSIVPLMGVCLFFYRICNTRLMAKVYNNKFLGKCIRFIGALCLEIYLVQSVLLTDKMNAIFPLNLVVMFLIIIAVAYLLRCLSRIWSQTFKDGDYDFNEIIKLF